MTTAQPAAVPAAEAIPVPPGRRLAALDAALDTALRVLGGVLAVALAALSAIVEIFYVPLRVGGVLVGISVVAAVVINYWLPHFTVTATGSGWAGLLPPVVWFGLMLLASDPRTEGDVLLPMGNWVALVTIFAGSLAFAFAGHRLLLRPR